MKIKKYYRKKSLFNANGKLRLSVFRSNKYIYAQIIDDTQGKTLCAHSSLKIASKEKGLETAKEVGNELAKKALEVKVSSVYFDRGRYPYKGQVKALAEGARGGGLRF